MDPYKVLDQLEQVVARAYCRVSEDRSGVSRSTGQQDDVAAVDCRERGWIKGRSYLDNSKSASRYSRDRREDFEALVADLEGDRFRAQVLWLWESSRGSRRVDEWVRLLDLSELRGVFLWVHTHSRLYDPANPRDRRTLLEDAVDSEYESGKTSHRIKRDVAASAILGRPHGRCPYGYRRIYHPHTRKLISQERDPAEAPLIEELFERTLKGHSANKIAREWSDAGLRTRSGKVWRSADLRSLLVKECYAGLRAHVPGTKHGGSSRRVDESNLHEAMWEGLVSYEDWHKVQQRVHDPERGPVMRPGRAKYLLSGWARCGVCIAGLAGNIRKGRAPEYQCLDRGCVRISMTALDEHIEGLLLGYLSRDEVIDEIRARDGAETDSLTELRNEVVRLRRLNDALPDLVSNEEMSPKLAGATEKKNVTKIKKLDTRIKALTVPSPLGELVKPGKDAAQRWSEAPISARRETIRDVFRPEILGQIRLVPAQNRVARNVLIPADERVSLWRSHPQDVHQDVTTS